MSSQGNLIGPGKTLTRPGMIFEPYGDMMKKHFTATLTKRVTQVRDEISLRLEERRTEGIIELIEKSDVHW
jgi:hypothetical protein